MTDLATRAYNHSWKLDPIVRSLLDTDFYVFTMQQFQWKHNRNDVVKFSVRNRTTSVKLAEEVSVEALREQLDYVKSLRFAPSELIWLRGQNFYGQSGIFTDAYIAALSTFNMPDYDLTVRDGQFVLTSTAPWWQSSMWEMPFLTILNELRYRAKIARMTLSKIDRMYARAKVRLHDKLLRLASECDNLNLTDFGTRRRHSFLWQEYAVVTAKEVLGHRFTGTSNVLLAMKHDLEAKGSNAHQLQMVRVALADNPEEMKREQYRVLEEWQNMYRGNMLVFLPDTYGTTQFLGDAPDWMVDWKGARPDSKEPVVAGEELIHWWERKGVDPKNKIILFSDGLDVHLPNASFNGSDIVMLNNHFAGRVGVGFGFGTNLTNDFRECAEGEDMSPISLVAKPETVNGRDCVKLSDNPTKATGAQPEVERYLQVFGTEGSAASVVLV